MPLGVNSVRVKPGDTVYMISQAFQIPTSVIIEANELQPPYIIIEGQLLKVPPGVPYYEVQPGDTLYQIDLRFNVITGGIPNTELIRQVNNLPSNLLFPGKRLAIPYAPTGRGENLLLTHLKVKGILIFGCITRKMEGIAN